MDAGFNSIDTPYTTLLFRTSFELTLIFGYLISAHPHKALRYWGHAALRAVDGRATNMQRLHAVGKSNGRARTRVKGEAGCSSRRVSAVFNNQGGGKQFSNAVPLYRIAVPGRDGMAPCHRY